MFKIYSEAYNTAVLKALTLRDAGFPDDQCEQGLEFNALFKTYSISTLPRPQNRAGHELRCEVVRPSDPLMLVAP